ncbi:MAG: hypothetical protein P9L98_04630 [Candidatus Kaelpia imicola]|nr:hypothetical protein [Candidatus Kaelpia imicola]
MKRLRIKVVIFIILFSGLLLSKIFLAEAEEVYPEWKIKLAYTLSAKGSDIKIHDPELAKEYYARAKRLYPLAVSGKEEMKVVKSIKLEKIAAVEVKEKVEVKQKSGKTEEKSSRPELLAREEKRPLIEVTKREEKSLPKITKPTEKKYKTEEYSDYPESAIIAEFKSVDARKVYGAEKLGPTVNTLLDPYYMKHKNFRIPYYKDREGLKIHPWIGVRGEYKYDEQRVGIESLMMEAQEFNQRRNDQIRDYISINKKEYYREEVILHIREWLPKFTFINHEEIVKRTWEAKKIWSSNNNTYYDNRNKRYYQLEYTIPRLKRIGYLKLKLRYGDELSYRTNDPAAYLPYESHLVGFETSPHISRLGRLKIKFEYEYWNGEYKQAQNQGWSERDAWGRDYLLEFELYNQKKFLRITPHFNWKKEQHSPSHDTWWTKKTGLKLQKNINGKLSYTTDWTYIDYTRTKSPETSSAQTISTSCWTWENEMEIELLRDLKLIVGLDYGNGLGFSGFDNITGRGELMLRKPGLIDLRFGYRYTDYINVNDNVDTVYFKLGLFI